MENGNGQYKLTVESRLTTLEVMVNEIKNNHLSHIEKKIDRAYWLLVTILTGIIADLISKFFPHL